MSDITSTYDSEEIFEELKKDVTSFSKNNTAIQVVGDFNGRTGLLNDVYEEEKIFIPWKQNHKLLQNL